MTNFIMMVGLPASGKSTYVYRIKEEVPDSIIISSDAIRKEITGSEEDMSQDTEVFEIINKRIKENLSNNISVIYDACNINKKRRIGLLKELKKNSCGKTCYVMATPFEECIMNNDTRDRKVPYEAIKRMYLNWCPPHGSEGWDCIKYKVIDFGYGDTNKFRNYSANFDNPYSDEYRFCQHNKHHILSLGEHMTKTGYYCTTYKFDDIALIIAAKYHDIGKIFTASSINDKGEEDGDWHYYNHQNIGAYLMMCDLCREYYNSNIVSDICNLIYYHMHPYLSWKTSDRAYKRDLALLGQDFVDRVMILHEADEHAH